ncbi:MAG: hypothetical protein J6W64_01430 [Bacilli bacterium]|nr:hypothetical protein [Bacilli bacterium]
MNKKLEEALQNVEMTYAELVQIANDITGPHFNPINDIVNTISEIVNTLTIDQIREYILQLQLKAFEISEIKEKSALKAELADALQKEKFATTFSSLEGTAAVKEKLATVEVAEAVLSETLYTLVANLFKTKVDQLHRLVAALQSILMSRMQETKFMNIGATNEIAATAGQSYNSKQKTILNEQF